MRAISDLCYNVPGEAIYGEITKCSIQKLARNFPACDNPIMLDIGSGAGNMLCEFEHVMPLTHVFGIEASEIRATISRVVLENRLRHAFFEIICKDMFDVKQLPLGITHSVSFDMTFPPPLMAHIQKLQEQCDTLKVVVTNHKYAGNRWILHKRIPCKMVGSGSCKSFNIYLKRQL